MASACKAKVYLQVACSGTWVDISGRGASVTIDGGEFDIGEVKVFGSDYPIVGVGKPGRVNVAVKALYTEAALEPYELIKQAFEDFCDHSLCVRWVPLGDTVGNHQFTTVSGILVSSAYPSGDASTPDPLTLEFTVTCSHLEESEVV